MTSDGFKKDDKGKVRLDLIPPDFLLGLSQVMTDGANKYGAGNWKKGVEYSRYYNAAMRHLLAFWKGEDTDPESGSCHLQHIAANMLILSEYVRMGIGVDDRGRAAKKAGATEGARHATDLALIEGLIAPRGGGG